MKPIHFCCASALAIALTSASLTPVYAQNAPAAADSAPAGDIVVTATREKTLLSKTPIALSAISGAALRDKGIVTPTALGEQVSGLSIDRTNGLQITIRGVTSTDGTEKGNPSAAFYIDSIYIARPQEADISFFDVHDVEVLKGPQGTLYGRNSTAGVINVITNPPQFGKLSAAGNISYGNYNAITADAYINLPATDWAAFRISGSYDSRDNFAKTALPGATPTAPTTADPYYNKNFRTNATIRLQGLFKLGDNGDLLLRGNYSKLNGSRDSSVPTTNLYTFAPDPNAPATLPANQGRLALYTPIGGTSAVLTSSLPNAQFDTVLGSGLSTHQYGGGDQGANKPDVNDTAYNLDGEFNYNFGPVKATYLGSIRQYEAHENSNVFIGGNLPGTFDGDYTQQSHELRLANTGNGPFKIQGGLYYFREESRIAFYIYNFIPAVFGNNYIFGFPQHTVSASKGAFTQATYKITPAIRVTGGVRYTADDLNRYGHTVHENSLGASPLAGGLYTLDPAAGGGRSFVNDGDITSKKLTWRVGLDADVGKGLLYGSIATGYKEGGFGDGCSTGLAGQSLVSTQGERCDASTLTNPALPFNATTNPLKYNDQLAIYYLPETLTDYEIGYRGTITQGVKIDTNVFYYDYQNLQLSAIIPVNGALQTVTTNAGKASVLGWEFQADLNPVKDLNVNLGVDLTDAHYKQFCPSGLTSTGSCGANANGQIANYAGQKLDRSPTSVFHASVNYRIPVGEGDVVANVGTRISSAYAVTVFGDTGSYSVRLWTPSQSKTQASLTYNAPGHAWYVTGFVKNIENKVALVTGSASTITLSDPRTFGARAGFKF